MQKFEAQLGAPTVFQFPAGKVPAILDANGDLYYRVVTGLPAGLVATTPETAAAVAPAAPAPAASRPVANDTAPAAAAAAPAAAAPPKKVPAKKAAAAAAPAAPVAQPAVADVPAEDESEAPEENEMFPGETPLAVEDLTVGQKIKVFLHMNPDDRDLWEAQVVAAPEGTDANQTWVYFTADQTTDFLREDDLVFEDKFKF